MTVPIETGVLFGVSLLCCMVGFYRFIYFTSVGYGISIAACGGAMLLLFREDSDPILKGICGLLVVFGCRLAIYLLIRRKGNGSFEKNAKKKAKEERRDMGVSLMMWVGCAFFYTLMVSPVCYRLVNGGHPDGTVYLGAAVVLMGVLLEWGADISKCRQKKKYPGEVCRRGLYRFVRCPNYFGEVLTWTGVLLTGVTSFESAGQWIVSGIGYVGIMYVMFSAAKRLEQKQNRVYGDDARYQRYVRKVPVLIPVLPLYSLEKWKFLGS